MANIKHSSLYKVLQKNLNGFLSLIYPDTCRICGAETSIENELICFSCEERLPYTHFERYNEPTSCDELFWGRVTIEKAHALLYFREGSVTRDLLHAIKYRNDQDIAIEMGRKLAVSMLLNESLSSVEAIVPIPLHSKKEFLRGYNQSMLIAQGICDVMNRPIIELLSRSRHHDSQTKKDRFERWENVADIFECSQQVKTFQHVVVVDDVLTTVSTLEAACRSLLDAYPEIKVSVATVAFAQ
jgi:competence protein ComFC